MKFLKLLYLLLLTTLSFAQINCDYSTEVTDSLGSYKATKDYMVSEKIFGGNYNYLFFSLVKTDDLPTLNVQMVNRSMDFLKTYCFDKNSKIYFQLNNGKIITMIHIDQEDCGTLVRDPKGLNNRITTGYFMFMKDSFEELKKSPISLMRIKYTTETVDYVFSSELISEMDSQTYNPDVYFINYLKCIE